MHTRKAGFSSLTSSQQQDLLYALTRGGNDAKWRKTTIDNVEATNETFSKTKNPVNAKKLKE